MLLMESEDGSADAYADIRVEERSRDETQNNDAGVETQDAGGKKRET